MDALSKVLPVIILFTLGIFLNKRHFFSPETMQDLKKLIVNITLPAALFLAFAGVSFQPGHLVIVAVMFAACVLVMQLGRLLRAPLGIPSPFFPALMAGFEAGMMGYAIFSAVYGAQNIYKFGIVDLGQVTFVFFVLVTSLTRQGSKGHSFGGTLKTFLTTPVILAILLGILANQSGMAAWLKSNPLLDSLLRTLEMLSAVTTPLIALVIGYEMRLQAGNLARPLVTILLRMVVWVPFGLLLNHFVVSQLLHLDPVFQAAVMTMVILPPPFVIPLFMKEKQAEDREYVINTLSLGTLVTLVAFSVVAVLYH